MTFQISLKENIWCSKNPWNLWTFWILCFYWRNKENDVICNYFLNFYLYFQFLYKFRILRANYQWFEGCDTSKKVWTFSFWSIKCAFHIFCFQVNIMSSLYHLGYDAFKLPLEKVEKNYALVSYYIITEFNIKSGCDDPYILESKDMMLRKP